MRRLRIFPVIATSLLASACRTERPRLATPAEPTPKVVTEKDYDRNRFSDPTRIDNQWFPLKPGMLVTEEWDAAGRDRTGAVLVGVDPWPAAASGPS